MNHREVTLWQVLESVNWAEVSKDRKISTTTLQRNMVLRFGAHMCVEAYKFAQELKDQLYNTVEQYEQDNDCRCGEYGGDDSFGDMLWHVIGMGHEYYNRVINDPTLLNGFEYRECFGYCLIHDHREAEKFEPHYHLDRAYNAYGKLRMMQVTESINSNDEEVWDTLCVRFQNIIVALEDGCNRKTMLQVWDQVKDVISHVDGGAYDRFYKGWDHNESAFYSNVLSDIRTCLFDPAQMESQPKPTKRQMVIEQLTELLNRAKDTRKSKLDVQLWIDNIEFDDE